MVIEEDTVDVDLIRGGQVSRTSIAKPSQRRGSLVCTLFCVLTALLIALVILPGLFVYAALVVTSSCYQDCRISSSPTTTNCANSSSSSSSFCQLNVCFQHCWKSHTVFATSTTSSSSNNNQTDSNNTNNFAQFNNNNNKKVINTAFSTTRKTRTKNTTTLIGLLETLPETTMETQQLISDAEIVYVNDDVNETAILEIVTTPPSTATATKKMKMMMIKGLVSEVHQQELFEACFEGDPKRVRQLVDMKQVDLNVSYSNDRYGAVGDRGQDWHNGTTCLMFAVANQKSDLVELLTTPSYRVDVDARIANDNTTALHQAAKEGLITIVQILVEDGGASVDLKDVNGSTALMKAASTGRYEVVEFLMRMNADVDERNNDGWTAFHLAAYNGRTAVCYLLFENGGIDVDVRTRDMNETALMLASRRNNEEVVQYLLDQNAKVNEINKDNKTALAMSSGTKIRELLLKYGASMQ